MSYQRHLTFFKAKSQCSLFSQNIIMKKSFFIFLILSLLTVNIYGQGSLDFKYSKFEDLTIVFGQKSSLIDDLTDVSFSPVATYTGQSPKDLQSVLFFFMFSHVGFANHEVQDREKFDGSTIILLVDGSERISGRLKYLDSQPKATYSQGVPYYITSHYRYLLATDFTKLKRLSEAKTVELRWYGQPKDYNFNSSSMASAKEMSDYFEKLKSNEPK